MSDLFFGNFVFGMDDIVPYEEYTGPTTLFEETIQMMEAYSQKNKIVASYLVPSLRRMLRSENYGTLPLMRFTFDCSYCEDEDDGYKTLRCLVHVNISDEELQKYRNKPVWGKDAIDLMRLADQKDTDNIESFKLIYKVLSDIVMSSGC